MSVPWQLDRTSDSHGQRPHLDLAVGHLTDWLHDQRRTGNRLRVGDWEGQVEVTRSLYLRGLGWMPGQRLTPPQRDVLDDVDEAAAIAWRRVQGRSPWHGNGRRLLDWADEQTRIVRRLIDTKQRAG